MPEIFASFSYDTFVFYLTVTVAVTILGIAKGGFNGLGLLAVPLGLALAWALVAVINLRSFGWTMGLTVSGGMLGQAPVLALAAGIDRADRWLRRLVSLDRTAA